MKRIGLPMWLIVFTQLGVGALLAAPIRIWAAEAAPTLEIPQDIAPPIAPRRDDGLDELPEEVFVSLDPKDDPSHPVNWNKAPRKKPGSSSGSRMAKVSNGKSKGKTSSASKPKLAKKGATPTSSKEVKRQPAKANTKTKDKKKSRK